MRQVEAEGLREQHEWHPLVVSVMANFVVRIHWADARMRYSMLLQLRLVEVTNLFHNKDKEKSRMMAQLPKRDKSSTYHRKSRREKAECVDDVLRDRRCATRHTPNVLSNILPVIETSN